MERPTDFGQCRTVVVVLTQAWVKLVDGLQNLLGFLHKNAKNLVVKKIFIRCFGFGLLYNRYVFLDRFVAPCGLLTHRKTKLGKAFFSNFQDVFVIADALSQPLQVVLNTGNCVGQGIQLFPVGHVSTAEQNVRNVALGGR